MFVIEVRTKTETFFCHAMAKEVQNKIAIARTRWPQAEIVIRITLHSAIAL